jgi:tetratricopeptide (TPR) repeat protein
LRPGFDRTDPVSPADGTSAFIDNFIETGHNRNDFHDRHPEKAWQLVRGGRQMPDIRLQDYAAKIKDLIRDDRHEEAIAHCQHILRHHPKYIEIYCLLGEACLERNMLREAIEFFQRTLSADLENLIARVGLGIIYGQQGTLPEAIWQMERAFELAPGNAEVRRELQRLYAERDGAEKARLKLNRGALGRLYTRNGLYERAIGEFHAVLRENPERPDISVALAEALWREGRRLEAVETCQMILEALPNCLKANLILGEIWMRGGHEDAGKGKLNLAQELDPENLVAQEMMGSDAPLPSEPVLVPQLDVTPDMYAALAPEEVEVPMPGAWEADVAATGLALAGEALGETAEDWDSEEIPDWLREIGLVEEEEEFVPEREGEMADAASAVTEEASLEQVPDWLQELVGKEEAPASAEEPPGAQPTPPEEVTMEELPLGEMPDWLRGLEPSEAEAPEVEEAALVDVDAAELPDWLRDVQAPRAEEAAMPPVGEAPEEAGKPEIPDSMRALVDAGILSEADLESAMAEMTPEQLEAQQGEETPDWLKDLAGEEAAPPVAAVLEEEVTLAEEAPPAEEMPDWLRDLGIPEAEEVAVPPMVEVPAEEALPAEEEALPLAEVPVEGIEVAEEIPESLQALVEAGILSEADLESAMAEMTPEQLEAQRAEEIPDWLKDLTGEEIVPSIAAIPEEEVAPPEDVPAWLRELEVSAEEAAVPPLMAEAVEEELPIEEVVPPIGEELEEEMPPAEEAPPVAEMPEVEAEPSEEAPPVPVVPAWLRELEVPEEERGLQAVAEVSVEEVAPGKEVPAWLRELEIIEEEAVAPPPVFEETPTFAPVEEEVAEPVVATPEEEAIAVKMLPEEAPVPEAIEAPVEEVPSAREEVTPPVVEEAVEAILPPTPEALEEEAPSVEEAAPPAELEMVAPYDRVEVEEEVGPPPRVTELLAHLGSEPRDYKSRLELARIYNQGRNWDAALEHYEKLISARKHLQDVIDDLKSLTGEAIDQVRLRQLLGDAYMQDGQLDKALEMYRLASQALAKG